ncbi:MAG: hypothetical protein GY830_09035, partial [Bacteroidetes bacterium]|nr:hypothetical protein [Bacteroidota bacterium]
NKATLEKILKYGKKGISLAGKASEFIVYSSLLPPIDKLPKVGRYAYRGYKLYKYLKGIFDSRNRPQTIPKNVIKDTEKFISSATKANRNNLSNVGRGLQKHSSRSGAFKNIKFSHKDANQVGEKVLRDILNSKNKHFEYPKNGCIEIYDKITGRGVSISREGLFNGFREFQNLPK